MTPILNTHPTLTRKSKKGFGFSVTSPPDFLHTTRDRKIPSQPKRKVRTEYQIGTSEPGNSPGAVSVPNAIESVADQLVTQWLLYEEIDLTEMYHAFELHPDDRMKLLQAVPPTNPDIIAHHITHRMVKKGMPLPAQPSEVLITGRVEGDGVQALLATVDGQTHAPDGRRYHITHSIDKSRGKKPFHSNQAILDNPEIPLHTPVSVRVQPKEFM
jgi:hypothetical protein